MNISKYLTPNDALRALVGNGKFHIYTIEASKLIIIMVEKDHAETTGQISTHFEKINKEYSISVRVVVDLEKSIANLTSDLTEPEINALISSIKADTKSTQLPPQMIGRGLRKPEPKEGEVWLVRAGDKNEIVTICNDQFLHGEIYKSHGCVDVDRDSAIERLFTQEERNEVSEKWREAFDAKDIQCQEHSATVTKLSEGLSIIADACKERGFNNDPFVDIVHLLNEAERKLCEPKEMVVLQIDGLPPLDSIVYMATSRECKGGNPAYTAKHPGLKVKIHSHFTDDRGVGLAAYTSVDGPIIGGVAAAIAFETEEEKQDRELDLLLSDVKFSGGDKVLFGPGVDAVKAALIESGFFKK